MEVSSPLGVLEIVPATDVELLRNLAVDDEADVDSLRAPSSSFTRVGRLPAKAMRAKEAMTMYITVK